MSTKLKGVSLANGRPVSAPLASLREPVYPTERAAKSARKTAIIIPLAMDGNYQTHKMKTKQSQWTPILHKPSNEQIFLERRELIGHWFDLWTDSQRKRFLQYIMMRCRRAQLLYLYQWFEGRVPLEHANFANVLPRFLSLYILSFLDPRSLSKAAEVCWHWKWLAETDVLWQPKCIKLGWFLPYKPKNNEHGAWKKHYLNCVKSLDVARSPNNLDLYGRLGDGSNLDNGTAPKKTEQESDVIKSGKLNTRPVWLDPDKHPLDLERAYQSMVHYGNPNQPTLGHAGAMTSSRRKHERAWTEPTRVFEFGLTVKGRKEQHRDRGLDDLDLTPSRAEAISLSASMNLETGQPVGYAIQQAVEHEARKPVSRRRDLSAGGDYPTTNQTLGKRTSASAQHPRLLIISSQITAMELLLSAVRPDVMVIPYEYMGTTLEALMYKVDEMLAGTQARSIGLLTEGCDVISLVSSMTTSTSSLEKPDLRHFWERLGVSVLPGTEGGHVDIFAPLAACDSGCHLIKQLNQLTGATITSPCTLTDSKYAHVTGDWFNWGKSTGPALLYLEYDKLLAWLASSDRVLEATTTCHKNLENYLRNEKKDFVAKLTGDMIFDTLGIHDGRVNSIAPSLVEALTDLTAQSREVDPLMFVGDHLLRTSGQKVTAIRKPAMPTVKKSQVASPKLDEDEEISSDIDSEVDTINKKPLYSSVSELRPTSPKPQRSMFRVPHSQTADARHNTALQILTSEANYMKHLGRIEDMYRRPLLAAVRSNKAIISQANIQMIFTDANLIHTITGEILEDLSDRLERWSPDQCIGDCFVKFQAKLKAYTNFHKNYQTVLATIDRCRQQYPLFRSFLKRTDCSPDTHMLTLHELYLYPARRIGDYIQMLLAQQGVTPDEHPDDQDLGVAVRMFQQLQQFIGECQEKAERDRQLQELERRIRRSPCLLEANRFLIKEQVVAHLHLVDKTSQQPTGLYEHIEDLGLFLFNDGLMFTVRTVKTLTYTRRTETIYHFHSSVALPRLLLQELPDSKFIKYAFELQTPKRRWILATESESEKIAVVSAIEAAIQASLDES